MVRMHCYKIKYILVFFIRSYRSNCREKFNYRYSHIDFDAPTKAFVFPPFNIALSRRFYSLPGYVAIIHGQRIEFRAVSIPNPFAHVMRIEIVRNRLHDKFHSFVDSTTKKSLKLWRKKERRE